MKEQNEDEKTRKNESESQNRAEINEMTEMMQNNRRKMIEKQNRFKETNCQDHLWLIVSEMWIIKVEKENW